MQKRGLSPSTVDALAAVVGRGRVLTEAEDLIPYSFDGTAALKQRPEAVVFPRTTAEVSDCVRLAAAARVPIVTRGSGTGLSGGSVPTPGSLVLCVAEMNAILDEISQVDGMRHRRRHATGKRFNERQACRDSLLLSFRQGHTLHRILQAGTSRSPT